MENLSNIIVNLALGSSVALLGFLTLKYNDRAVFTARRTDIPSVRGIPLFGVLFEQIANGSRFIDWTMEYFNKMDAQTICVSVLGVPPQIITIDPAVVEHILKHNFSNYVKGQIVIDASVELLGHGIFASNGEQWRYQRKAASLVFNVASFRDHFAAVFMDELNIMSEQILDKTVASGEPIDFHDMIYKFTLDSFVAIGVGKQLNTLTSKESVPFATSFDICQRQAFIRAVDPFCRLRELLGSVSHPREPNFQDDIRIINEFAYDIIKERKAQIQQRLDRRDLLTRFMNARNPQGQLLNDKELRDTILNFIIAGRDTTAQALSWMLYYLLLNPNVEKKLIAEIREHIGDKVEKDAPKLYETIKKMTYAHAVFYETLRLEPSVPSNAKMALQDDVLPDGTIIRKNDQVGWVPYAMGRSKHIWGADAEEFNPERWITPRDELRREAPSKWPAFHAGPRICLGQNLATLEALVAISILLKRFKFSLVSGQKIEYVISLTHPMKNGIKVFVEKRSNN
ncbi:cytochrome P450 [Fennellomyces sp. T-0311]|nr:cytochrome P450 [Fennellomyces sp. T-0311]